MHGVMHLLIESFFLKQRSIFDWKNRSDGFRSKKKNFYLSKDTTQSLAWPLYTPFLMMEKSTTWLYFDVYVNGMTTWSELLVHYIWEVLFWCVWVLGFFLGGRYSNTHPNSWVVLDVVHVLKFTNNCILQEFWWVKMILNTSDCGKIEQNQVHSKVMINRTSASLCGPCS